jgi:hypothetical protein
VPKGRAVGTVRNCGQHRSSHRRVVADFLFSRVCPSFSQSGMLGNADKLA